MKDASFTEDGDIGHQKPLTAHKEKQLDLTFGKVPPMKCPPCKSNKTKQNKKPPNQNLTKALELSTSLHKIQRKNMFKTIWRKMLKSSDHGKLKTENILCVQSTEK